MKKLKPLSKEQCRTIGIWLLCASVGGFMGHALNYINNKPRTGDVRYKDNQLQVYEYNSFLERNRWACIESRFTNQFITRTEFKQYKCGVAGRKWRLDEHFKGTNLFDFQCSKCGLWKVRDYYNLTPAELQALEDLGLIER